MISKPRILQMMAGAAHGGAETAFVDMCIAMKDVGIEQEIVTRGNSPDRVKRLKNAGLTVHCLPFGGKVDFYTPWQIKKIIKNFKPQIVQSWMSRAASKMVKSDKTFLNVSRLGNEYKLKYFAHTDCFVAITPSIREYLIHEGVAPDKIRHINNFAETEIVEHKINRAELNTPEDAVVLLSLARLHEAKALDVLIRAVVDLPQVHAWLAGEGPLRGELEQLAKNLGIAERIHFLGWRNDRAALLEASDICVFPSRFEPFGTVFVQAWANRTPLISSTADGPRQFVRDGEDGLIFPIDDVAALKKAIEKLIADSSLRERLVDNGYVRYQNEFTKEKTVQAYLDFYDEIMRREDIAR